MKALSLRQPWAWAILHAGKRIENRDWGTAYRGPLLLHASKSVGSRMAFDDAVEAILSIAHPEPGEKRSAFLEGLAEMHVGLRGMHHAAGLWRPAAELGLGGIVGRCRVVDLILPGGRALEPGLPPSSMLCQQKHLLADSPWYTGEFGFVLADVEPLPFRPLRGALGLFDVDETLLEAG